MEFLTSSPGIMVVLNRCDHMPIYRETKSSLIRPASASGMPSVSSLVQIPRSPSRGLTYGSGIIMPQIPTILRSSSVSSIVGGGPIMCAKRRAGVPQYDAINDPHLRDYFERKFKLSSAKRKKFKAPKPGPNECIYKIRVRTSNLINAGTDAKVYITICGYQFTVPRTRLFNRYDAIRTENGFKYKFERNSTNTFKIVGVDVRQISHIIVEHDGREMLNSWHLQDIQITHSKSHRTWLFECNDWLSLEHGLGKTRIQLTPTRLLEKYNETDYEVVVVTGDKKMAGTDSNVFVTLFGPRNRCTQKLELKNGTNRNAFETGQTDVFKLTNVNYVGPIEKLRIEHDNSGKNAGWFLERVVVTDLKDPKVKYFCPCSRWLAKDEDDGQISRDLVATNDLFSIQKVGKYRVTVFTGNKRGAGTDADVSIVMYGSLGDTGEWKLDDEKNNFERGMKDEFEIECPSIGEIKRIRIGHNNKGIGAGWYLNKVIIDDLEKGKVYEFIADRWLAEDEGSIFKIKENMHIRVMRK